MSDKAEIIKGYNYIRYGYLAGAIIMILLGLYMPLNDIRFFLSGFIIFVPIHLIFIKLFPYKGRNAEVRQENRKSYGISRLLGFMSLVMVPFVCIGFHFFTELSSLSSIYLSFGINCVFGFFIISRHINKLKQRDEIFIR